MFTVLRDVSLIWIIQWKIVANLYIYFIVLLKKLSELKIFLVIIKYFPTTLLFSIKYYYELPGKFKNSKLIINNKKL